MIFKIVAVLAVLFLVYILFFRKGRENSVDNKKDENITDEMIECKTCGTFVSKDEAILSNGKHYCSKECIK